MARMAGRAYVGRFSSAVFQASRAAPAQSRMSRSSWLTPQLDRADSPRTSKAPRGRRDATLSGRGRRLFNSPPTEVEEADRRRRTAAAEQHKLATAAAKRELAEHRAAQCHLATLHAQRSTLVRHGWMPWQTLVRQVKWRAAWALGELAHKTNLAIMKDLGYGKKKFFGGWKVRKY